MPRKASHGWSNRQQGGFRRPGPVKQIFKSSSSGSNKRTVKSEINQSLSLHQASAIGAMLSSHCQKCGRKKVRPVSELLIKHPNIKNSRLSQINSVCENKTCRGKIVVLQYSISYKRKRGPLVR